jgi:cytochrome c biogenesis protein CcmG/thiol:disulfide interchange protein DsbE
VKHPARIVALAVALVVVVLGVVLALNVGNDPQQDAKQSQLVGKAAPDFDLPNLTGGRVTSAGVAGKSVIVNFWNSWCIPCQQEEPALQTFYAEHKDDSDFVMIGIVREDETQNVRAFVRENSVGWTVALDPKDDAALAFATRGQPETYAISPSGVVAAANIGPMSQRGLELFLDAARASG